MLIVGSLALKYHGIDIGREPSDTDVICTSQEFNDMVAVLPYELIKRTETENSAVAMFKKPSGKRYIIDASIIDSTQKFYGDDQWVHDIHAKDGFASPSTVLMMKLSHRFKDSIHFEKTRNDIFLLKKAGITLDRTQQEALESREYWTIGKGYKLNLKKNQFFTDNVPYIYDHDSIHRAVAMKEVPAYTLYLKDGEEVMCDEQKFNALHHADKLAGVLEEAYVLALERAVIPHGTDPDKAFQIALRKVCTSITSGWFREFAWQNYNQLKICYNSDYVDKFNRALKNGKILPYTRS